MSGQHGTAKPPRNKLDRFNLPPPRAGILRGIIRNIRVTHEEAAFGPLEVVDFDLYVSESDPPVPVRMRGNDYSRPLFADSLGDVADPDPSVRPVLARRVVFPHHPNQDCVAFYPGLDDPNTPRDRFWSIVTIVAPIAGGALLALLLGWYFGLFH
jgi:hypothetical protein